MPHKNGNKKENINHYTGSERESPLLPKVQASVLLEVTVCLAGWFLRFPFPLKTKKEEKQKPKHPHKTLGSHTLE